MIHIRIDADENSKRRFRCGLGPDLPPGDTYRFDGQLTAYVVADCPGCNPNPRRLGTPLSELSGQPGKPGYERWKAICRSWGYD